MHGRPCGRTLDNQRNAFSINYMCDSTLIQEPESKIPVFFSGNALSELRRLQIEYGMPETDVIRLGVSLAAIALQARRDGKTLLVGTDDGLGFTKLTF